MSELISIIVPVYNVEEYLPSCIESILAQSYKIFELILIDDGSTDKSGIICDSYAQKDNRIRVIHSINQGVSQARNKGISLAVGKYIAFVDSDDFIEPRMYDRLLELLEKNKADICLSNRAYRNTYADSLETKTFVIDGKCALNKLLTFNTASSDSIPNSIWSGVFISSIVKQISFGETIHHYEDFLFMAEILDKSNKVVITNEPLYHYRVREGSANHVNYNHKTESCLLIANQLLKNRIITEEQTFYNVLSFFISQCYFHFIKSDSVPFDLKNRLKNTIKDNRKAIIRGTTIKYSWKICILSWLLFPRINKIIVTKLLG